ncbi:structural maintenance of chromosomes protein, putative [Eimeria necatrix]|uniref:Structural maintenance of chromosomes protein n=1 Tax=Eimeria necatrix TaxID=51315 RepID=U6N187_9EIME|nr:structural maintenance of chromosomes protein, putative [Eimeria necatrix]CDJ67705.1 structural maintenance of chromosomes protein, putative [Eimeria necatrix]
MYIHELILDGFKSYSSRVVVGPLHPQFNAITGLNGTGKSNILDAICFVLGISNHSLVRVARLEDLVYKQGQAGITKATVTIKLKNDPNQTNNPLPPPYKEMREISITRQIIIGGRDRYLLNSRIAQVKEIKDFFQCCQLNINSPHFMIQQGKITKVINMKPKELLGLIEEVSGTRMYELKRANAVKMVEKKEQKLQEIQSILSEEIQPNVERLQREKADYQNYVNLKEALHHFQRFDTAYRYFCAKQTVQQGMEAFAELQRERSTLVAELEAADRQREEAEKQLEALEVARAEKDAPLRMLRKRKEETEKALSRLQAETRSCKRDLDMLHISVKEQDKEVQRLEKSLENRRSSRSMEAAQAEQLAEEVERLRSELKEKSEKLQAVSSGGVGASGSIRDLLKTSRSEEARLEAQDFSILQEITYLKSELEAITEKEKNLCSDRALMENSVQEQRSRINELKCQIEALGNSDKPASAIQSALAELQEKQRAFCLEAQEAMQELRSWAKIDVRLPKGIDPSRFAGQIFELVSLKQEYATFSKAMQVRGKPRKKAITYKGCENVSSWRHSTHVLVGGKLEYIVVSDKDASKAIFKENNFAQGRRRVTLLPLSDCHVGRVCDKQALMANRRLVGLPPDDTSGVLRCLDMVEYDVRRHSKVAEYAFGGGLICRSAAIAQKITYQKNCRLAFPTATAEGDVFQTGGIMAGGSVRDVRQTMLTWKRYKDAVTSAEEVAVRIRALETELAPLQAREQQSESLRKSLRLAENQLRNTERLLGSSDAGSCRARMEEVQKLLWEKEQLKREVEVKRREAQNTILRLETEIHDIETNKDKIEATLSKAVKALRTQLKQSEGRLEELQLKTSDVRLQLQTMQQELEGARSDLASRIEKVGQQQQQLDAKYAELKEKISEQDKIEAELMEQATEAQKECQQQNRAADTLKRVAKAKEAKSIALKKLDLAARDREKTLSSAREDVKNLLSAHEWLVAEEPKFNQTGTPYDFKQLRPETARQRIQQLKADIDRLRKNVNSSAGTLLEKTEAELQILLSRKAQVEADREKIREVIASLDEKKQKSLGNTWRLVDGNFAAIFEQLLPNAQAKLVQVDPDDLMKGLEMKIAFHHKWKDSLSELSGGQRSLLALSLILALLKVKPAPVYILDEVDAALDLSHTQNIGHVWLTALQEWSAKHWQTGRTQRKPMYSLVDPHAKGTEEQQRADAPVTIQAEMFNAGLLYDYHSLCD